MTSCWQAICRTRENQEEQSCHPCKNCFSCVCGFHRKRGVHGKLGISLNAAPCQIPLLHEHRNPPLRGGRQAESENHCPWEGMRPPEFQLFVHFEKVGGGMVRNNLF